MGTPYTRNRSPSKRSASTKLTANTRKRTFDSLDDSLDESPWDLNEDGRPKTRRVNPLRLAIRLGPDLVAEMEALIVPGAKMPTFSVRKDFQERYCVDRRHIYDYFHSRGTQIRYIPPYANFLKIHRLARCEGRQAYQFNQGACNESGSSSAIGIESSMLVFLSNLVFLTFSQPPSATVKCETDAALPRPLLAKVTPSAGARGRTAQRTQKRARLPRPSATISSKRIKRSPSINLPDALEMLPGGVPSESALEASSSGTHAEDELTYPKFTVTTELSDDLPEKGNTISDFLQSSSDTFGSEYFSSPTETSTFPDLETAACGANLDMLMTIEEHRLLTQDERTELYNLIDNSMPQAHGIEESSGTYNFYMNERSHSCFDPLFPINRQVSPAKLGVQGHEILKSPYDSESSMDYVDVRKWLSEEIDLSDIGLGTHGRYSFRNEFDPSLGVSDILSSLDGTCDTISGSAARLHMHVQNQYPLQTSIDIHAINEVCSLLYLDHPPFQIDFKLETQ
jgi:antiviral helicase SKI2